MKKSGEKQPQNKKTYSARATPLGGDHASAFFFRLATFLTLGLEFITKDTFLPM